MVLTSMPTFHSRHPAAWTANYVMTYHFMMSNRQHHTWKHSMSIICKLNSPYILVFTLTCSNHVRTLSIKQVPHESLNCDSGTWRVLSTSSQRRCCPKADNLLPSECNQTNINRHIPTFRHTKNHQKSLHPTNMEKHLKKKHKQRGCLFGTCTIINPNDFFMKQSWHHHNPSTMGRCIGHGSVHPTLY